MKKSLIHLRTSFDASFDWFAKQIRLEQFPELTAEAEDLYDKAKQLLIPQSVHLQADVDSFAAEQDGTFTVVIEGTQFNGKVLDRLDGVHRVFPYVVTCGTGLEDLDLTTYDFFAPYWVDALKVKALRIGMRQINSYMRETYHLSRVNTLNPGSGNVDIWPIEQLRDVFSILGDVDRETGVTMTESCLMVPNKTLSGFFFDRDHVFESCAYCERANCPDRRVPYSETL